ncbi:MAG: DUF2298 domain-containing protein [Chloroflexota bacterium]|nr:DUF2298 domain-containing protein [Chloroflexota bacterium]
MYHAVAWYVVVQALGLLALPLAFRVFRWLPDRGYSLTKPIGLLLVSYGAWILGVSRLAPYGFPTLLALSLALAAVAAVLGWASRRELRAFVVEQKAALLVTEAVFAALFALWVFVVSHTPAINHTEKPMDFAFMNAVLRAGAFPPEDPWLAGHAVSYYYFGHLMMASLAKLAFVPSSYAYNLAVALVPALVSAAAYGLAYNLLRASGARTRTALAFGLAAPVLVGLVGNLEGALEFVRAQGWGGAGFWSWVSIDGLNAPSGGSAGVYPTQTWWWWRATRVINTIVGERSLDYTITEFPFFSFLLGDLHPHVLSLPFLLLNLSLGLNLLLSPGRLGLTWVRDHPWQVLFLALSLGALGFIKTLDLPVYAALLGLFVLAKAFPQRWGSLWRTLADTLLVVVPVGVAAVALYLPFYRSFSSQVSGILPVRDVATRPFHLLLVWGLLGFLALSFLLRQAVVSWKGRPGLGTTLWVTGVALAPFLLWALIEFFLRLWEGELAAGLLSIGNRFLRVLPLAAVAWAGVCSALAWVRRSNGAAMAFPLLLVALAAYLIMGVELFYLQDLFGNRMNTVFKLYYQAWLLLAVAGAYGLWYWWSRPAPRRLLARAGEGAWALALAVLLAASLYYPPGAIMDKADHFSDRATLDGLAFVQRQDDGEYRAIQWLRDRAPGGRIVEAVGDDYSEYGRISASTGLPTILGWEFHEFQWRGSRELFRDRRDEVAEIYRTPDLSRANELLDKYNVRYIYVGRRERASYGTAGLTKFEALPSPFHSGDVVIYERLP